MSGWQTLETDTDVPPMRVFSRAEIDILTRSRRKAEQGRPRAEVGAPERRAIVEEYLAGVPVSSLTTQFKRGHGTVCAVLEEAGVRRRG